MAGEQTWNSITCNLQASGKFHVSATGVRWSVPSNAEVKAVDITAEDLAGAQWFQIHPKRCRLALATCVCSHNRASAQVPAPRPLATGGATASSPLASLARTTRAPTS